MEDTLKNLRDSLIPLYGKGETEAIIRLIFHYLKGWSLTDMLIHKKDELSDYMKGEVQEILKRLLAYEPIQYITGEVRFHGLDLKISPGVLIPRTETEELVDIIIEENRNKEGLRILDVCTGSGCIAFALSRDLPFSSITAIDFSENALKVALENNEALKTKVIFIKDDIFTWNPSDKFDIIVSNPPYVLDHEALTMDKNVLNYEPHEALFVRDEDPLIFYSRISDIAKESLTEVGRLYFEINPLEAENLKRLIISKGFSDVDLIRDTYGKLRFLSCVKDKW